VLTGLIWLWIGTSWLNTVINFWLYRMLGNYWLAERRATFQEELSSMELVYTCWWWWAQNCVTPHYAAGITEFLDSLSNSILQNTTFRNWIYFCPEVKGLLTYLLTELSPSWGPAICAAPQELPRILWNPKVQYCVHKSPPLVHILSHINPILSYLSEIVFNICSPTYVLVSPVVSFLLALSPVS
jgi:hypothetical protein